MNVCVPFAHRVVYVLSSTISYFFYFSFYNRFTHLSQSKVYLSDIFLNFTYTILREYTRGNINHTNKAEKFWLLSKLRKKKALISSQTYTSKPKVT